MKVVKKIDFFDNHIFYDGGNLTSFCFDISLPMHARIVKS